jgi:hypothetical protein
MFLRSDARHPRLEPCGLVGVYREARDFPQTKSTFRSFFLLKFPSNLQLQPSSLQHQPQHSTSITITSCSCTRCCDQLPPHPLTLYFFVLYTTHTPAFNALPRLLPIMGAPIRVPPTRPSTPTFEHQLPPTRPSTPTFGRIERIAEAPSRADPNLPLVETSSPIQAPPSPMEASQPDRVNPNDPGDDMTEGNEQNDHQTTSVGPQIAHTIFIYMFLVASVSFAAHPPIFLCLDSCRLPLCPFSFISIHVQRTFDSVQRFHNIPLETLPSFIIDRRYLLNILCLPPSVSFPPFYPQPGRASVAFASHLFHNQSSVISPCFALALYSDNPKGIN